MLENESTKNDREELNDILLRLEAEGAIYRTGEFRLNDSGELEPVWKATPAAIN